MTGKTIQDLYIVLVEPSPVQARVITNALTEIGLNQFDVVHDGASALQKIAKTQPDLVISAMYFPDMTASDLVQTLRLDADLQHIAFMLITSETGFDQLDPVRQAGVTAVLPKPFDISQLKRALLNTLNMMNPEPADLNDLSVEDMKVLIVDDSSMARKHIRRVLRS